MAIRQHRMYRSYAGYFLLLVLLTREASACSVTEDYLVPSVAERTSVVSHVVIASLSEVDDRVVVSAWLKGGGPNRIEVSGTNFCNSMPRHHKKVIMFLTPGRNPDQFELLRYGFWSGFEEANEKNVKEAKEVLELGLHDYLTRKGHLLEIVGTVREESSNTLQALLKIPGHELMIRVSPGDVVHETTSKILEVSSTGVTVEMVTFAKADLPKPVIVRLNIPD